DRGAAPARPAGARVSRGARVPIAAGMGVDRVDAARGRVARVVGTGIAVIARIQRTGHARSPTATVVRGAGVVVAAGIVRGGVVAMVRDARVRGARIVIVAV